jgi:nitrite reductase/ring-hydroxylating ferredoxin subunit
MRRTPALVTLTRREVCGGLAACIGAVVVSGCGGDSGNGAVDAPADTTGSGGGCGTSAADVGTPATFTTNKPVYFSTGNFFVVRDSGGLYALTARCTHEGATTVAQTSDFYCPRHGAMFDFNGAVTRGPAVSPLQHYAMCILANGHIGVTTSMTVAATQRLNA